MKKYRLLMLLFLMGAVLITSLKLPTCPKQRIDAPVAISLSAHPCSSTQTLNNGCTSSASYWLEENSNLKLQLLLQSLVGLLSFLFLFTKYNSPADEIYRPPILIAI
jgi:hypothetical protein